MLEKSKTYECSAQVEWFVSDEDSQQLHAVRTDRPGEHASRMDSTETVSHLRESAEVVVVRDQHGSSSCTGGPALAQSLYWLYRATVSEALCPSKAA
jgi:hypothetical protein